MAATRDDRGRFKRATPKDDGPTPLAPAVRPPIFRSVYEMQRSVIRLTANVLINSDIAYRRDYRLQRMMRHDPDVMGPLLQRQMAVALLEWDLVPEDPTDAEAVEIAARMKRGIQRMRRWHDLLRHLQEAVWYGPSGANVIWAMTGDPDLPIIPHSWRAYHPDSITFTADGMPALRVGPEYTRGETVATENGRARILDDEERAASIIHVFTPQGADFRDPYESRYVFAGRGLRDIVWFQWLLKQTALQLWSTYVERYSMGTRIGRYPHSDPAAQEQMEEILRNMVSDVTVLLPRVQDDPDAYSIDIQEPNAQASSIYSELIGGYLAGAIKELIIGQSATTEATATGLGSSVGDQHAETFNRIIRFDARALADTLTEQLVGPYQQMVNPSAKTRIRFEFAIDEADPKEFIEAAKAAYDMGVAIPERQIRQRLGLDEPEEGEAVVQQPQQQPGGDDDPFGGMFGDGPGGGPGAGPDGPPAGPGAGPTEEPPPGADAFSRARAWLRERYGRDFDESKVNRDADGKFAPKGTIAGDNPDDPNKTRPTSTDDASMGPVSELPEWAAQAIAAGVARSNRVIAKEGESTGWTAEGTEQDRRERRRDIASQFADAWTAWEDGVDPFAPARNVALQKTLYGLHADPAFWQSERVLIEVEKRMRDLDDPDMSREDRIATALDSLMQEHDDAVIAGRGGFTVDGVFHDPDGLDNVRRYLKDGGVTGYELDRLPNGDAVNDRVHVMIARRHGAAMNLMRQLANHHDITAVSALTKMDWMRVGEGDAVAFVSGDGYRMAFSRGYLEQASKYFDDGGELLPDGSLPAGFDVMHQGGGYTTDATVHPGAKTTSHEFGHVIHNSLVHGARNAQRAAERIRDLSSASRLKGVYDRLLASYCFKGLMGGKWYDRRRKMSHYWGKISKAQVSTRVGSLPGIPDLIPDGYTAASLAEKLRDEIGEYAGRYPWELMAEATALAIETGTVPPVAADVLSRMGLPFGDVDLAVGTDRLTLKEGGVKRDPNRRASRLKASALDLLAKNGRYDAIAAKIAGATFTYQEGIDRASLPDRIAALPRPIEYHVTKGSRMPLFGDGGVLPDIRDPQVQGFVRAASDHESVRFHAVGGTRIRAFANAGSVADVVVAGSEGGGIAAALPDDAFVVGVNLDGAKIVVSDGGDVFVDAFAELDRAIPEGRLKKEWAKASAPLGYQPEFEPREGTFGRRMDGYGKFAAAAAMAAAVKGADDARKQALRSEFRENIADADIPGEWEQRTGIKDAWERVYRWAGPTIPGGFDYRPTMVMAWTYAHAKMGGHVPEDVRAVYRAVMGPNALPLPEFDTKRPERI